MVDSSLRWHYVSYDVMNSTFQAKYLGNLQIADTFLLGAVRKVARGYRMVTSPMTSRDPMTSQSWHHNLQHAISLTVPHEIRPYFNIIIYCTVHPKIHTDSRSRLRDVRGDVITKKFSKLNRPISKTNEIRVWSLLITYRKSHMLLWMVTWRMTSGVRVTYVTVCSKGV